MKLSFSILHNCHGFKLSTKLAIMYGFKKKKTHCKNYETKNGFEVSKNCNM